MYNLYKKKENIFIPRFMLSVNYSSSPTMRIQFFFNTDFMN